MAKRRQDLEELKQVELESAEFELERDQAREEVDEARKEIESLEKKCADAETERRLLRAAVRGKPQEQPADGELRRLRNDLEQAFKRLNCAVCHEAERSVVLVPCMHTFCGSCIENSLVARNRKCPTCQTPFAKSDVRPFHL